MKLLSLSIAFVALYTFTGCQSANNTAASKNPIPADTVSTKAKVDTTAVPKGPYPTSFFNFDEVLWYTTDLKDMDIMHMSDAPTEDQKITLQLLRSKNGIALDDTTLIHKLEQYSFVKKPIGSEKIKPLHELFQTKAHKDITQANCMTMYRDILIFKYQGTITGTAKICFTCAESVITGAHTDASLFGQSGDFKKLGEILAK